MSRAEVQQLDDRGMAAWDQHDTAAFASLLADDFTFEDVMAPEPLGTREQVKAYMDAWFEAFPEMHARTNRRVVSDDEVAAEIEFTGRTPGRSTWESRKFPPRASR
jgi:steroid delta-isomerase-like uncharacterized protein